jgi:TIR domain
MGFVILTQSNGVFLMTTRKGIFISHIHEEAKLGAVVKDWVSDAFRGSGINAFLSSDKSDLPAGRKWLEVIEKQIDDSGVMISLISPLSLTRPWVNIELGAAWIRHVPVIPLCHSRQTIESLPRPFDDFSALTLDHANAAKDLLGGIADALQIAHSQKYRFADFLKEMRDAARFTALLDVVSKSIDEMPSADDLPDEQVMILQALAAFGNQSGQDEYLSAEEAASMSELRPMVFKHHAGRLSEMELVQVGYWSEGRHYKITGQGAGWLIERNLMPE